MHGYRCLARDRRERRERGLGVIRRRLVTTLLGPRRAGEGGSTLGVPGESLMLGTDARRVGVAGFFGVGRSGMSTTAALRDLHNTRIESSGDGVGGEIGASYPNDLCAAVKSSAAVKAGVSRPAVLTTRPWTLCFIVDLHQPRPAEFVQLV